MTRSIGGKVDYARLAGLEGTERPAAARILNVTPAEYLADPCATPSLSSSIAHTIVARSPLHAWSEHPRFGNQRSDPTTATAEGSLLHRFLLGKGANVAIIHADDFRTKAAREERDQAIASGQLPMLARQYHAIAAAAETLRGKLAAFGIELAGESEVAIEWSEPGEHGPVLCRGMMDHLIVERGAIYDIKKIRSAHPRTCARHAVEYGYDIQHAAYTSGFEKLRPELAGRIDMVFVFLELEPPYAVVPARLDGGLRELGGAALEPRGAHLGAMPRDEHLAGVCRFDHRARGSALGAQQRDGANHADW